MLSFNYDWHDWYEQSEHSTAAIWKFDWLLNTNDRNVISKRLIKKLNIPRVGSLKVETSEDEIIITDTKNMSVIETIPVSSKVEQQGYGFGFFSVHYAHSCPAVGSFNLENCVYTEVNLVPHKLYVDPNGGTWRNSSSVTTLEGIEGDTCSIGIPVRNGYTFTGWKRVGNSGTMSSLQCCQLKKKRMKNSEDLI